MSDILINGMEMPKNCSECKFFAWKRGVGQHCAVDDRITFHATLNGFDVGYERKGNCPLVSVPKHGRLIDADALEQDAQKRLLICNKYDNQFQKPYEVMSAIALAPTIIEAEECE